MTWDSLIDRVLTGYSHQDVSRVKVRKYLQEAEIDFALGTKCNVKNFAYMPYDSDDFLELPKDFIEIVGNVEFKTKSLERVSHFENFSRFKNDGTIKSGNPDIYFIRGDKMYFYPAVATVGLLTFSYVARPTQLDSSITYKKLFYDDLESDQFYHGDAIAGRTSNATATISDVIDIEQKKGTLVLSSISGVLQNDEIIVETTDEQAMWLLQYSSVWSSLLSNWQRLGLGGMADVNGVVFPYSDAGASPTIPENYHSFLICYAKAALSEDIGIIDVANSYRARYEADKENIRIQASHKGISGVQSVIDVNNQAYL